MSFVLGDPVKSLVRIRSSNANGELVQSGTGFVIFRDQSGIYILTCRHVVRHPVTDELLIANIETESSGALKPATVVFDPEKERGLDLAVIKCAAPEVRNLPVLPLSKLVTPVNYEIASYHQLSDGVREEPKLTNHKALGSPSGDFPRLELVNNKVRPILSGNSGSPVIESFTHRVVAVVTDVKQGYIGSDTADRVIFALPVDNLERWKDKPTELVIQDLQLPAAVHRVATDLIAGNPVQILLAASPGFDNEMAIIQETVNRTVKSPAARNFPVNLYRWGDPILPLGDSAPDPVLDDFHGIIFVAGTTLVEEEAASFRAVASKLGIGPPGQRRQRIIVYRLSEEAASEPGIPASAMRTELAPDDIVESLRDDFQERFWNDYQRIFPELVDLSMRPRKNRSAQLLASKTDLAAPYRGLLSYRVEDAPIFHGRTRETTELRDILAPLTHGLLAVVGPSGSGKSSLVRAGLLNRLRLGAIPGSAKWKIVDLLLSKHANLAPTRALANELLDQILSQPPFLRKSTPPFREKELDQISDDLEQQPAGVVKAILSGEPLDARFILFVDQFEEIFTLGWLQKNPNEEAAFLTCLLKLAQHPRVNVILTMRDDFYARLLKTDISTMIESQKPFWLKPADDRSLLKAIYLPAALSGFDFEDQDLIVQILRDAGSGDNLPLLSYALQTLVTEVTKSSGTVLTRAAYKEIGRVQGVIQKTAQEVLTSYDTNGEVSKSLFRRLITVSEDGTATKRPARVDSTWSEAERELKNALVDARLLVTRIEQQPSADVQEPAGIVEIAHETLLNDWPVMKKWIEESTAALVLMQEVEATALKWREEIETRKAALAAAVGSSGGGQLQVGPDPWEETRIQIDRDHLWGQERLNDVYDAVKKLGLNASSMSPAVQAFIRPEWDRLIDELNLPISHKRRSDIGERLAHLGDPRPGVRLLKNGLPDVVWCRVPGGIVNLTGSTGHVLGTFDVKPFCIARYPITMEQFNVFAEQKIYQDAKWWADLAVEPHKHTVYAQKPTANHPAQFVSWYQAIAFCRWFSETQYPVRLPTEWEWVQAATGGNNDYLYPWGPRWDTEKANHRGGAYLLMAVGMYPVGRSPGGAFDMSGNMFEWCLNEFDNLTACQLTGKSSRTTRGGAWFSNPEELSVRHRLRDNADGYRNEGQTRIAVCIRLASDAPPSDRILD